MHTFFLFIAFAGLVSIAHAEPAMAPNYVDAAAHAKEKNIPFAVYIHGSSWHRASKIFGEKIWSSPEFTSALKHPAILTNIHIRQHLSEEESKKDAEQYKGWNSKTVRTYPAIQVYGSDIHLLKTYTGTELRVLASPASLTQHIDHILEAAVKRRELLEKIKQARAEKNTQLELEHLVALVELPLNNEAKITEQLKKVDPSDTTGWQARISFKNWEFVRHITGLIKGEKTNQALTETDKLLATSHHTQEQRALILGAKGKVLVAQGQLAEAWQVFQEAHRSDPKGANGKAMLSYGTRVAGLPLREAFPKDSIFAGKPIDANLTRDRSTFTMSSAASDNSKDHASLFKGNHARSGFAFHTDAEKDAHIIIDLNSNCQVKALRITNRSTLPDRAKTLTVWGSSDQKEWQQIWAAKKAKPVWEILLASPVTARYLKVGLNSSTPENFHLRAVDAYGVRP